MHSVIKINIKNFEESAKLYAIIVQNEIKDKNKYIISEYERNKELTYVSAVDRNEELISKLMEIQRKYQEMCRAWCSTCCSSGAAQFRLFLSA